MKNFFMSNNKSFTIFIFYNKKVNKMNNPIMSNNNNNSP